MRTGKSEALIRKDYYWGKMKAEKKAKRKAANRSRAVNRRIARGR